jgi:hypothetical protein
MKIVNYLILVVILATTTVSCSKNSDNDAPATSNAIDGIWQGSLVTESSKITSYYAFDIKPNGVLHRLNEAGSVVGTGTWSIDNNIFSGTYKTESNTKYSVIGSPNNSKNKILGNWGFNNSVTNGGTWEMNKK